MDEMLHELRELNKAWNSANLVVVYSVKGGMR
jgi:hypothetical protein